MEKLLHNHKEQHNKHLYQGKVFFCQPSRRNELETTQNPFTHEWSSLNPSFSLNLLTNINFLTDINFSK